MGLLRRDWLANLNLEGMVMYKRILEFLRDKPEEYQLSTSKFWDDEHISGYMLDAHLNPDADGASRKHEFIERSAVWIASLVPDPAGKELLDLGCGPGLYATVFDDLGFRVTGVDFSGRSITYAKERAFLENRQIAYHYMNYLEVEYERQFDVITLIYCDFGVLKREDRHRLLGKVKRALKPGGMLVLDGFTSEQYVDFEESEMVSYERSGFWSDSPYACIQRNFKYDEAKIYLEQYVVITEDGCECFNIWNQEFSKESLTSELQNAGFTEFRYYDDVSGKPYTGDSKTICVVAGFGDDHFCELSIDG